MADVPLYDRLRQLDELVRAQGVQISQLQARLSRQGDPRNPRLAITSSTGTYPARSDAYNTYQVKFVDSTHVATEGVRALTTTPRAAEPQAVAHNVYANVPFVPEGQLLEVWWDNNRWWFCYEDEILLGELASALDPGGSAQVRWLVKSGGSFVYAVGGALTAWDRIGDKVGEAGDRVYFVWNRQAGEYWILQLFCG